MTAGLEPDLPSLAAGLEPDLLPLAAGLEPDLLPLASLELDLLLLAGRSGAWDGLTAGLEPDLQGGPLTQPSP